VERRPAKKKGGESYGLRNYEQGTDRERQLLYTEEVTNGTEIKTYGEKAML